METLESLIQELKSLPPMSEENRRRLDQKIRLEFNYNSNHLEGNTLTYGETQLLLLFDKTTGNHDLREYEEMKAHDVAFEMIKQWASEPDRPLTEAGLRELHRILLVRPFWKEALTPDGQPTRREIQIGAYKSYPNSVRLQNGEIFHYATPEETPIKMGELIAWYREEEEKKELTPVELAALLHYRFVRIHPFDDGNGRMARLLMNFVLLKNQLAPIIIKSTDKKNYLFALNQADAGEIGAFVDYIVQQLCWSLNLYIRAANGEEIDENDDLQKEISVWKKGLKGDEKESSHRTTELVLELFLKGGLLDLFKEFESQIGQFRDLFYDSSLEYMLNGGHTQSNFHNFKEMVVSFPGRDSIFNLSARAVLRDFKPLPNPSIAFFPHVAINFEFNRYNVRSENGILMIKPYTVNLSSKDRSDILDPIIRQLFTDVKTAARIKG